MTNPQFELGYDMIENQTSSITVPYNQFFESSSNIRYQQIKNTHNLCMYPYIYRINRTYHRRFCTFVPLHTYMWRRLHPWVLLASCNLGFSHVSRLKKHFKIVDSTSHQGCTVTVQSCTIARPGTCALGFAHVSQLNKRLTARDSIIKR